MGPHTARPAEVGDPGQLVRRFGWSPLRSLHHRACDTIENINRDVLEQNTRALVRALNAAAIAARAPSTPSQKAVDLPEPNL